ncbi:MAG: carbohydrate kinase family protein [Armatimonadota bacterium]|nr:carbohydrate kinase family protein [Armatimonadota bacterium]MDR7614367.1 carbohydrate kinase family protein [Armatimonadota bacterium]
MLSVGIMVADVIVRTVDAWPELGRLRLVESIELQSGGLAHTTAITLAKLGVPTAAVGRVGADVFGGYLIERLRHHGVEPHVVEDPAIGTSITVVAVAPGGERSFLHFVGANARLVPEDVPDHLLSAARILHLGGYFVLPGMDGPPAARLLARARAHGCRTSLDVAWDARGRWMEDLAPCLAHLDVLFANQDEVAQLAGTRDPQRAAAALRERGVGVVAVKLGERGAYVDAGSWQGWVPAFDVPVVDTTGAGDAFCGGFLAAWLRGWSWEEVTRFANAVGALCVTAVGGTTGVRSFEETVDFLRRARVRN